MGPLARQVRSRTTQALAEQGTDAEKDRHDAGPGASGSVAAGAAARRIAVCARGVPSHPEGPLHHDSADHAGHDHSGHDSAEHDSSDHDSADHQGGLDQDDGASRESSATQDDIDAQDDVVQALVVASYALQMGDNGRARVAVDGALRRCRASLDALVRERARRGCGGRAVGHVRAAAATVTTTDRQDTGEL